MKKPKKIFIAATMQNDGKTTVSIGLIMSLKKRFKNIGFIKPIGQRYLIEQGYKVDEDSVLIEDICGIKCHLKDMSPIAIEKGFTEQYILKGKKGNLVNKINESFERVSKDMDLVIIEGTGHAGVGSCFDLSNAVVAKILDAPAVLITSGGIGRPIDEIMLNSALFQKEGVSLTGVIVNKVLPQKYDKVKNLVCRGFKRLGINVYGVMPYKKFLSNPSISDVIEETGGRILCGKGQVNNVVDKILVGAMEPHEALQYMEDGSLIITPGDREDMILAATGMHLSRDSGIRIAGMVLSGGLTPHDEILGLVKKTGIPMILSEGDTYSVAAKVHDMAVKIKPKDKLKIASAIDLIEDYVDIDRLVEDL
ncbi:AAA family ATPase [Omnitrophica bacterium]|nr:AAA family ATPase [Candidatus Omnitrophota bacterium]